ncbi:phosphomevalonate kinase, partial [Streptosporangium algeriense]
MTVFHAPGKLFIAGEYAVLQPGQPAVLMAVDRHATVTLTGTAGPVILTSDLSGGLTLRCERVAGRLLAPEAGPDGAFARVLAAIDVMERLADEQCRPARSFHLSVTTDLMAGDGRKLGLGSSAAVTVATCGALARFYGLRLSRMELYRLAMLASLAVAPASSGGDVAASALGGWVLYRSPRLTEDPAAG